MNQTCSHCGANIRPGARFCSRCGASQVAPASPPVIRSGSVGRGSFFDKYEWLLLVCALVCTGIFVVVESLALTTFNLSLQVANPDLYKNALSKQGFYADLPGLIAEQLVTLQTRQKWAFCDPLEKENWQIVTQQLLTGNWLQEQAESLIDQFFTGVNSDRSVIALSVNLAEFKKNAGGAAGLQAYKDVFQTRSECSDREIDQIFAFVMEEPNSCIPLCKLPPDLLQRGDFVGGLLGFFWDTVDDVVSSILEMAVDFLVPASYNLQLQASNPFVKFLRALNAMKFGVPVAAVLCLPLLFGSFLSRRGRTLRGWLAWWGMAIAGVGIISAVLAIVFFLAFQFLAANWMNGLSDSLAAGLSDAIQKVVQAISISFVTPLAIQAVLLIVLGGGMLAGGYFVKLLHRQGH